MKYAEAMGQHGVDKPDLRIPYLVSWSQYYYHVTD